MSVQKGFDQAAQRSHAVSAHIPSLLSWVTIITFCLTSPTFSVSNPARSDLTLTLAGLEIGDGADTVHGVFPNLVLSDRPYRHPAFGKNYAVGDRPFVAEQAGLLEVTKEMQHQLVEVRLTGDGRLYLLRISTHGQINCDDVYEKMESDYGEPFIAGRGYAVWSSTPVQLNGRLELRCLEDGGVQQTLLDQQLQDRYTANLRLRAEKRMRRIQPHQAWPHF